MPGFPALAVFAMLACAITALPAATSTPDGAVPADDVLSVTVDRPDALYQRNEVIRYEITLTHLKQAVPGAQVTWRISKDGIPPIRSGTVALDDQGRAVVTGSLDEPGFLQFQATYQAPSPTTAKPVVALAGAGVEPTAIAPSLAAPADFDAFWTAKKRELAAVPMNAKLTAVPAPPERAGIETFAFEADCLGAPARGYYARPIGAKPKSCPALLYVEGAGVYPTDIQTPSRKAQRGMIALVLNAHGIPVGKPKEFYTDLANGDLKDYRIRGRESRDTYYFLGMYQRDLRGLEFLTSQPEWDGRTLIVEGGSQGGAQSLAVTALDPRVTFTVAQVPAQCDHSGMVVGRVAGWPKVVPIVDGKPDHKVLEAMRYFDIGNFAARIQTPVYSWVGFIDTVCPPTTCYAALNQIKGPKTIRMDVNRGHNAGGTASWAEVTKVIDDHIASQAKGPAK